MLTGTPGAVHDRRLVTVYGDVNATGQVWDPKAGVARGARDVFVRYSDDQGATWSDPVNLSGTANLYSALTDWNGDGVDEPFWGDTSKPTVFNKGDYVVVTWTSKYCPEAGWTWGTTGQSSVQGEVAYPDLATYPNPRVVPYSAVYAAISLDGGATWTHGGSQPPLQLTYGRRDAVQDTPRGAGPRWVITWQEDPEGLQAGEAEGPGEGYSGARATKGTDAWYTWTADLGAAPLDLRTNRTPLTNHSSYDRTGTNGFPLVGEAGERENHAASRPNVQLVKDGSVFTAVVAYEETKGLEGLLVGKTVQYHAFPFDAPVANGPANATYGDPGAQLTPLLENARRVRFVVQEPDGVKPAIFIFWKQGEEDQGGPSDIVGSLSLSVDQAALLAAPRLNFSAETPTATSANLADPTMLNPIEDARAHRAVLRGKTVVLGYTYTWNQPVARYTDLANYNFWIRRSEDGGATWFDPVNLSQIEDTTINVKEPRLVKTPGIGSFNPNAFIAAWGTETNPYEGIEEPVSLDVRITYSLDKGATFAKVTDLGACLHPEFESQLRPNEDCSEVYAVWMHTGDTGTDVLYSSSRIINVPATLGTLYCFGDGGGAACPCGNESLSDTGEGCVNSTGVGALLTASGSASVAADDLQLAGTQMPPAKMALLISGSAKKNAGFGSPFGDGLRCVSAPLRRLGAHTTDGLGSAGWGPGLGSAGAFVPGHTGYFQVWYRDLWGPCSQGVNLTNALEVTLLP
jgi:hypothetical protein